MLARTHWPAALGDLARTIEHAGEKLDVRVRADMYDDDYVLLVVIPRKAVPKKGPQDAR